MSLRLPLLWKSSDRDLALASFPEFRLTTLRIAAVHGVCNFSNSRPNQRGHGAKTGASIMNPASS
jgi:hypothetical protein